MFPLFGGFMSAVNFLGGFGIGYQYTVVKNKEEEVRQGKNHYISSVCVTGQVAFLGATVAKVAETVFKLTGAALTTTRVLSSFVVPILSLPIGLLMAAVKHGDYEKVRAFFETHVPTLAQFLPRTLSQRTIRISNFLTEHGSTLIKVAMIVSAVALTAFGQLAFGGTILATLAYREIDTRGFVPRKLSLFLETHLPIVTSVGLIIGGSFLLQVLTCLQIASFFPPAHRFLSHKLDDVVRRYIPVDGHKLASYEAPLNENKKLTAAEMHAVLDGRDHHFDINPAHCAKFAVENHNLPQDFQFEGLLSLYDQVDWNKNYFLIRSKLKDDEIFTDFLKKTFPEEANIEANFDSLMTRLAQKENQTKEVWAAKWMRSQMVKLIDILNGKIRVKGEQKDLDTAISNCSKILPYLKAMPIGMEQEDLLLKLAVEAGDYCARGIKRTSGEILDESVVPNLNPNLTENPQKNYELNVLQALQNERLKSVQQSYHLIKEQLRVPGRLANDVHAFDVYRKILSLGFYPMTQHDRNSLQFIDLWNWTLFFSPIRQMMHREYSNRIDQAIVDLGEARFTDYIRKEIGENRTLSEQDKEDLLEKYTSANNGRWTVAETNKRFHRLMLVMLGVLQKKI